MSKGVVYIDFIMEEFTELSAVDACCKISSEISLAGLQYGIDFWFHDYDADDSVVKFGFRDQHEAYLLKLAGINQPSIH